MGRHSGGSRDEPAYAEPRPPRTRLIVLGVIVIATLAAWGVLVRTAIDFGQAARSGESTAWVFLAVATMGATACLFTTVLLGARLLTLVKGGAVPAPARVRGGRRAAR